MVYFGKLTSYRKGGVIMIDKNKLKAAWVEKGLTQRDVANKIGISEVTFSRRMRAGAFGTDEAEKMIKLLSISNPSEIFFAEKVT